MRILLRDKEDQTLVLVEAEHVIYNPDAQELYVSSANYDYTVHKIVRPNADSAISELYASGLVDLTTFEASSDE